MFPTDYKGLVVIIVNVNIQNSEINLPLPLTNMLHHTVTIFFFSEYLLL